VIFADNVLSQWHDWVNTGALAAFAVFVCWLFSRLVMAGGKKAMELGERYVTTTESLHQTLKQAEDSRTELCERHATGLEAIDESVKVSNVHLDKLVQLHTEPGQEVHDAVVAIHQGSDEIHRFKEIALRACQMCREVSEREIPNSAEEVAKHCEAIEKALLESVDGRYES